MASKISLETLTPEYNELWKTMVVDSGRMSQIQRQADKISNNKSQYVAVSILTGVPWYIVGIIHQLEAGGSFKCHLHNGDPLTARTVQVPRGLPVKGSPPFSWIDSAVDALQYDKIDKVSSWTIASMAYAFEKFNGFGYRLHYSYMKSPYLWAGSNHYTQGKYTSDGTFDASAVSKQIGAMVLLKVVAEKEKIDFNVPTTPAPSAPLPEQGTPPDVANAQKSTKEIIKGSRTLTWLYRLKAAIIAAITTVWGFVQDWFTFDGALKVKQFLSDNMGWLLLGSGMALVIIFQLLQDNSVKTFKEGKWTHTTTEEPDDGPAKP